MQMENESSAPAMAPRRPDFEHLAEFAGCQCSRCAPVKRYFAELAEACDIVAMAKGIRADNLRQRAALHLAKSRRDLATLLPGDHEIAALIAAAKRANDAAASLDRDNATLIADCADYRMLAALLREGRDSVDDTMLNYDLRPIDKSRYTELLRQHTL